MSALNFLKRPIRPAEPEVPYRESIPRQPTALRGWSLLAFIVAVAAITGAISGGVVAHLSEGTTQQAAAPPAAAGTPAAPPPTLPDVPAIIEGIRQSVVAINVTTTVMLGPRPITTEGAGSGFVLSSDGMIATNAHVVADATKITATLPDGTVLPATLVGSDTTNDLAVVHVDRTGLTVMPLGQSSNMRVGDLVIAVGNALALEGGPTASMGIVSALDRTVTTSDGGSLSHLIQTDAAINEGDSGGPLTNRDGELVGINTIGTLSAENIGFAIEIDDALPILQRLRAGTQ